MAGRHGIPFEALYSDERLEFRYVVCLLLLVWLGMPTSARCALALQETVMNK